MKMNKRILSLILAIVMVLGMVPMATAADDAAATCTECGSVGGHTLGCSQFVIPTCEECHGDLLGEKAGHSTACSQYVAPETTPAPASEEGTEGTTEGTTVATTVATTEGATEGTTVATTEATTAPSTEPSTEATTEATTEPSTEATTEATTEPTTETTVAVLCDMCDATEDTDGNVVHAAACPYQIKDPVVFNGISADGISTTVFASGTAFPDGTVMTVKDTTVDMGAVNAVVNGQAKFMLRKTKSSNNMEILGVKAVDISFGGEQPSESVILKLNIPADEVPFGANKVVVVHFGENGPENVASQYLYTNVKNHSILAKVDGFSSYAAVFVNQKYNSQKMSDLLAGNSRYSVTTFKVDLFDYDPVTINNALNGVTSDGNGFHFTGYGVAGCESNSGINNSSAEFAKQGVLDNALADGLPVVNHLKGTDAGKNTGKVLFSDSEYTNVKTIYNDIPFEVIYDSQTDYYEYKSSANHAQLNNAKNKIELYADTLSTNNQYVQTLDLSKYSGQSDMTDINATASSFKATYKDTGGTVGRLDPYVSFAVSDVAASTVGKIYIKAKIPAAVGKNNFQLFFNYTNSSGTEYGPAEERSYIHPYTANGDWVEFVIDTANVPSWTGTIKAVRVDLFDGNKGTAVDPTGSYAIEIAQISLIQKDYDAYATRGGFYPFSQIQDSYPGNNDAFSFSEWEAEMGRNQAASRRASRSIYNPTPSPSTLLYDELCYGMSMEFDFYIPVSKVSKTGADLTYYFNGDDDLWVFVDDQLVLDIGGGHGAITGWVNFTKGTWEVENAVKVTGYNSGAEATNASKLTGTIAASLSGAGKHTMKIFYLERGGSVSNCYMKYNLPQTPTGSVIVSKEVKEQENADLTELKKQEFEFKIEVQDKGSNGGDKHDFANQPFYIIDRNGEEPVTFVTSTSATGTFVLKHKQEAVFEIDENHQVYVTETTKAVPGYNQIKVEANGEQKNAADALTKKGEKLEFKFVNTYDEIEVEYTYIAVNPAGCPAEKLGTVKDPASANYGAEYSETVGVAVGDPNGSVAKDTDTVKFVGWFTDPECKVAVTDAEATVNGKNLDPKHPVKDGNTYVGDTFYAKFEFMYGNLTISKEGISDLDNHVESGNNKQEQQTTIYQITGESNSGVDIDMEVVIVGNNSVTIRDIPVGDYTVTEKTDWSWRYDAVKVNETDAVANGKTAEIRGGQTTTVPFENSRERIYWLSGDNIAHNLFKTLSSKTN